MKTVAGNHTSTSGTHFIAEFSECSALVLDSVEEIESVLSRSIGATGSNVVSRHFHRFRPNGVTGCVILPNSQITIHTWPEAKYASVDFFCSEADDLSQTHSILAEGLQARLSQTLLVERGHPAPEKMIVSGHRRVTSYIIDCRGGQLPDSAFVEHSPGRGFGLFAASNFNIGEIIYETTAWLTEWDAEYVVLTDLGRSLHDADSLGYELHLPLIEKWPRQVLMKLGEHYDLAELSASTIRKYVTGEGEREVLITGFDGLINHSNDPNVVSDWSDAKIRFGPEGRPNWIVPTRAIRPIGTGEELFVDYRESLFDFVPPTDWLP